MSKWEYTGETKVERGVIFKRIRAVAAFGDIAKGDVGGWLERDSNLSQSGDA